MQPSSNTPKTNKNSRAGAGEGAFRSRNNTGQELSTTLASKDEAAIVALLAGVKSAYAAADPALLGGFEEIHAILHPFFRRQHFIDWPILPTPLCPFKKAERQWFLDDILDLASAAWSAGIDNRLVQKIVYAPVLAAEREAHARFCRRTSNLHARRTRFLAEMAAAMREKGDHS